MHIKGFIKVGSELMLRQEDIIGYDENAKLISTPEFKERLYEQTPEFREPIITFINDIIPYNWAVCFTPHADISFDVNIYCENVSEARQIEAIIQDKLKDKIFEKFYYKGSLAVHIP